MKTALLLTAILATALSAREISSTNSSEPARASYDTVASDSTTISDNKEVPPEEPQKVRREKQPASIQPFFTAGLQFYSSRYNTGVMALNLEAGVLVNRKHMHTAEGYVSLFDWSSIDYKVDRVWGINYNYLWLNNFGTKFLRLDMGVKAGYNYYGEIHKITREEVKTVTFGGPRAALNLKLGRLGIGGGYTMLCGYREYKDEKTSTRIDQFSLTFGVRI